MHSRLLGLLLAAVAPLALAQAALAAVLADPQSIALGMIEPRASITRIFRLVNTGTAPVTIVSATPTCTCTTLDAAGKVIPAQGSIEIPVAMKVSAATGVKSASVAFAFSDGSPIVRVAMSGEVAYAVRGTTIDATNSARVPYINAFQDPATPAGSARPPLAGVVSVASIDGAPFTIQSVMNEPARFVGFNPASDPPRNSYEIGYDLSTVPCEKMPPYLIIATDHPKAPVIDLRVRHACTKISPTLPFAEYRANLGAIVVGAPHPFEFELKHSAGWKVVSTTSKDPRFTVKLVAQSADAENAMISLVALVDRSVRGIVLAPVTMTAVGPDGTQRASDFWVYFAAQPPAPTAPAPTAPDPTVPDPSAPAPASTQKAGS